jgi:hypothetical protein
LPMQQNLPKFAQNLPKFAQNLPKDNLFKKL